MPALVAHVVHRFGVGGLENGLVNLLNHLPAERLRHVVVCLDDYTDFTKRIKRTDVQFFALKRQPGKDVRLYRRLWRLLRELRPEVVHTRNLSALEAQFSAALAGVPIRIHGEHGRDVFDLHGRRMKYNLLRKIARPFVHRYVAVSQDLERWLIQTVGVPSGRVVQIYNGVNAQRFQPRSGKRPLLGAPGFLNGEEVVIGSVGRMAEVKDHATLVKAFVRLLELAPEQKANLRLVIAGDGPARPHCIELLRAAHVEHLAWLPGERDDIPELMRSLDLFVLPSLGEGVSNTILEAMSAGLPVIATRVGGNPELVAEGTTGTLVPPADPFTMAATLKEYVYDRGRRMREGLAARAIVQSRFSIESMTSAYAELYDGLLRENVRQIATQH